jgi:hypothetical protein
VSTGTLQRAVRPTWKDVVLSFTPPARRTDRVRTILGNLPLALIVLIQGVLTWRLSNVAFNDEGLYIDAGHSLLALALHGTPDTGHYGTYFSGSPAAYPVVAALVDNIGGLDLVRLMSLACTLGATLCVFSTSETLFGRRTALLSALVFSLSGSVLFLGKYATYDAPCLLLVALALLFAVSHESLKTAGLAGGLLALAAVTKYAGVAFLPFVLVLMGAIGGGASIRRRGARVLFGAVFALGLLGLGDYAWGSAISEGLRFTTTNRRALDYKSYPYLFEQVGRDVGLLVALSAVAIVVVLYRSEWRQALTIVLCLGAGAALPAGQIRIHEYVSLDKHTAFSALFFALPAGVGLNWLFSRGIRVKVITFVGVWILLVNGLSRSSVQYHGWPSSIAAPIGYIRAHPVSGNYLSFDANSEGYYTRNEPDIKWVTAYYLFGQGQKAVTAAVKSEQYSGFVFCAPGIAAECHSGTIESGPDDRIAAALMKQLSVDPDYRLVFKSKVYSYEKSSWFVWQRVNARREATVDQELPRTVRVTSPTDEPSPLLRTTSGPVVRHPDTRRVSAFRASATATPLLRLNPTLTLIAEMPSGRQ